MSASFIVYAKMSLMLYSPHGVLADLLGWMHPGQTYGDSPPNGGRSVPLPKPTFPDLIYRIMKPRIVCTFLRHHSSLKNLVEDAQCSSSSSSTRPHDQAPCLKRRQQSESQASPDEKRNRRKIRMLCFVDLLSHWGNRLQRAMFPPPEGCMQ